VNTEHPAGYVRNAPAGTYDHCARECLECACIQPFFKRYKSQEPLRCTVCGKREREGFENVAAASPLAAVVTPTVEHVEATQPGESSSTVGDSPSEDVPALLEKLAALCTPEKQAELRALFDRPRYREPLATMPGIRCYVVTGPYNARSNSYPTSRELAYTADDALVQAGGREGRHVKPCDGCGRCKP